MKVRTAVILLAVLVVAFIAIMAIGATRGGSSSDSTTPSWVEKISSIFSLSKPLDPVKDLGASSPSTCRSQFVAGTITLAKGDSCTLLVNKSTARLPTTRTFSLTLTQGGVIGVTVDQPDSMTIKETLDTAPSATNPASVDIKMQKEGGSVQIDCSGDACTLTASE